MLSKCPDCSRHHGHGLVRYLYNTAIKNECRRILKLYEQVYNYIIIVGFYFYYIIYIISIGLLFGHKNEMMYDAK